MRSAPCADERCLKNAQCVARAAKRLNVLVQDLVDTVLLGAGKLEMSTQPIELGPFVADVLKTIAPMADVSRVRLELRADLPLVEADPSRLERILMNLLTNALKYSPPESGVVVRAELTNGEITTAIADHGAGIAPEDMAHVFERFCKLRTSHQAGGRLGLGLFVTKTLVEAHQGRVWAESRKDQGTTPAEATGGLKMNHHGMW